MGVIKRNFFKHVSAEENPEELLETAGVNDEQPEPDVREQPFLPAILPHRGRGSHVIAPREGRRGRGSISSSRTQEDRYPKGHKKRRRYENNKYLLSLAADRDDLLEEAVENRSVFTQLLQEKEKMQAWNLFLSFSEENQAQILAENKLWLDDGDLDDSWVIVEGDPAEPQPRDLRRVHPGYTPTQAFETMCPRLKAIFNKRHFPMGTLYQLESEICNFFHSTPKGCCVLELKCSYDRMILHAICHYNSLQSQSYTSEDDRRETQVRNKYAIFAPPEVTLADFVRQYRSS